MSANPTRQFVSVEEYLEHEAHSETRSEYFDGEIFPMQSGTPQHATIVNNVGGELRHRLKNKPCRVYSSSLMMQVPETGLYTYPDVAVICGEPRLAESRNDVVTTPNLIVEVLSTSTGDYDRGEKFENYRTLPSLIDYLTISQQRPHVEHYTRQAENRWLLVEYADLGGEYRA